MERAVFGDAAVLTGAPAAVLSTLLAWFLPPVAGRAWLLSVAQAAREACGKEATLSALLCVMNLNCA